MEDPFADSCMADLTIVDLTIGYCGLLIADLQLENANRPIVEVSAINLQFSQSPFRNVQS